MKRNLLLLIVLCCTMTMLAQNGKISYQAVVRDSENHLVYDTPLQVTVSLANSETGTAVYSEQHNVTSNANGLISLLIGDGQNKQGHWEDVQWNTAWVTATVRSADGQTQIAEHHLPLSAVPYALYADFADSVNLAVLQDYLDEHHYVTEDELPAVQANADWTETNPDTASYIKNKPDLNDYEKKSELCGDVKECIKDTLGKYTTSNQIDTLLGAYYDTTHTKSVISDTATALRAMMGDAAYNSKITLKKNNVELDSFRLNQQTDKAINIPVPTTVAELSDAGDYVTKEKLNDTLSKYTTSKKIDTLLDAYAKTEDLAYYELKEDLCGDVKNCIKDTLGKYTTSDQIDTLLGAYYDTTHTKSVISDTATALRNMMVDAANDGQLTIIAVGDTTRFTANQATNDTVRLNKFATKDTLNKYTTSDQIDTLLEAYATTEDLAYYERQDNLCRDVKDCIKDTLNHYTTSNQVDTLLRAYYDTTQVKSVISDTATALRNMMVDAANDGQLTIIAAGDTTRFTANQATNDTVRLNKFATKDTLNKYTTSDQIDTLLGAYAKTADLANYERQDNLCRDVKTCIKDTLSKYTTTNQLDTVIRKYDYATNTRVKNDSTWLQANIDTVSSHIRAIIPTVNDNAITIQVNGKDVGDFTLNQSSDETINVQHVVTDTAANTLTGKNTFTDTNYVQKRGFSFETPGKTTQESCQVMVNACDLLAIFDSLSRRIDTLQKNLNTLMNSVPPVFNSLTLSDTTATTMKVTADFSSPGTAITFYEFCYRRHDGVGGTQCVTSTTNEVVLTGLQPFTTYDFTASATNIAGTTPSDGAVIGRTYAKKPSGNLITEAVNPRAIKVTVEHLNFGGAPSGNVKIYYKKKGTATQCSEDISDYGTPITFPVSLTADDDSTFARTIDNLEASELYCMVVELVNIDSTKVLGPQEKTSGGTVALEITSNANYGTLDVCEKPSVAAVYTAVPSEWPSKECTYQWEIVGTSVSQNTDTANHVEFNHTVGNYTISCTATHPTYGTVSNTYSITVTNTGHVPTFTLCSDSLQVNLSNILYADTIKWGDNTQEILSSNSASHPYQTSNNYTITANNSNGCVASKEIPVGVSTMHPCTVSSKQSNERGASETTIDSLQDVDGNWYAVAQIGNLCWMKSNLRTTHYSDGTEIANGTGTTAKNSVSDNVAYYYRPSSSTSSSNFAPSYDLNRYNFNTYGLYYNWKAVMRDATSSNEMPSGVQGVCPVGWHVPSEREWDTLVAFVQTLPNANYYDYQQVGYLHVLSGGCEWDPCNNGCPGCPTIARNSSEFTALPAGQAASIFSFNKNSGLSPQAAFFWTSTAVSPFAGSPQARNYTMYGSQRYIWKSESYNSFGFSVRCVRDYENATPTIKPTVTTEDATNVGIDTAKLNGSITIPDGVTIMAKGFKFKAASASDYNTEYLTGDELVYTVKGLTPGTEYTYRAFAIYDNGTEFGVEKSFTTQREPSVSTGDTSNVGMSSATLHGTVTNPDDATITAMGFEYKLSDATSYTSVSGSLDDNALSANLEGLQPGQTYTYKAFITYNGQTVYGHDSTFKTKAVPTVTTSNVGFVGEKTAILNGTITNPDHVLITAKGFQWKLSSATGYTTTVPVDGDELVYNLSGLDPGTEYTYRTYITYVGETHYSTNEVSFTTKTEPTVYTETPININFTSATLKGTFSNVSSLNIEPVGFEWKETAAENFTNEVTSVTVTGDETAYVMSYDLSGLTAGKSYDYRAFITHAGVREYQNVVTFSTWTPPTVLTNSASGISTNTVTLNGTVNNPSGVIIAKRGFQYKADGDNSYTTIDTCTGEHFSAVITGLQANKAYHFRSFITYGSTTVYGNETDSTFTTKHEPTVVTNDETNLGTTTATLNGSVNNPDNVTITKGFEWKLKTADKYDTVYALGDDLTYDLANLTANTEYVFRAFVNFDGKTVYDADSMFKTLMPAPTLSIKSNAPSSQTVCSGGSTAVLYTAAVTAGEDTLGGYNYSWEIPSGLQYTMKDSTCTVIYAVSGTYTVSCTASPKGGGSALPQVTKKDTIETVSKNNIPSIKICQDEKFVEIKARSNTNSIEWGDGNNQDNTSHQYKTGGTYVITAKNTNNGCKSTQKVAVGNASPNPCQVAYRNISEGELGPNNTIDSVSDADGNWYGVVQIGEGANAQCWMRSNLRTTKYSDSTSLLLGTNVNGTNITDASKKYYFKPNINSTNSNNNFDTVNYNFNRDGLFYNWTAVMNGASASNNVPSGVQGICPNGWHVPSNTEWVNMLSPFTYSSGRIYLSLISGGCEWVSYGSSNETYPGSYGNSNRNNLGLNITPTGIVEDGVFKYNDITDRYNQYTYFWTSTQLDGSRGYCRSFKANNYNHRLDNASYINKYDGASVRCVRNHQPIISLGITADVLNPVICNEETKTVNYTATITRDGIAVDGCSYSWSVSGGNITQNSNNSCTVEYSSASTYTVSCTITNTAEGIDTIKSMTTVVSSNNTYVTYCDEDSTITLKSVSGSPVSLAWGDGLSISSGITAGLTHKYAAPGAYTIAVTGSNGCVKNQPVAIAGATLNPCTVPSAHPAQTSINGGGYQGAADGKETINGEGKITSVIDYDGNIYPVVQIGSQCWMAENLRCTHSPSTGTYLVNPEGKTGDSASYYKSCKHAQWMLNDSITFAPKHYGLLYNWCAAVDTYNVSYNELPPTTESGFNPVFNGNRRGICPKGWHIPTDAEWSMLEEVVYGQDISNSTGYRGDHAGKLSKGCDWVGDKYSGRPQDFEYAERNSFGFGALPAGSAESYPTKKNYPYFYHCDYRYTYFWTSTSNSSDHACERYWGHEGTGVYRHNSGLKGESKSVRCVRDE